LVHQCQRALNDISAWHVERLYWVPGHVRVRGNEIADGIARNGSERGFLGPEPVLGVSRRDIQNRQGRWLNSQHCASWNDPSSTLRQAQELISGPSRSNRAKFCPLTELSPGWQLVFLPGITPWEGTSSCWSWQTALCVGGVAWRRRPWPMFYVNARPGPHSDVCIWAPSFWNQDTSRA
jgi:hypothetical protein